ncbi:MAG TPA: transglutaminase family protein [Terrimicrobiaceae bacterium]
MILRWMEEAASGMEEIFRKHGVQLTLGGEPTFVPLKPEGAEWNFAAVGPTKLSYARKVAESLCKGPMKGSACFFCPGKLYPGEVNPRWVLRILANRDGTPLFHLPARTKSLRPDALRRLANGICKHLSMRSRWLRFLDRRNPGAEVVAMPIDHDDSGWRESPWMLAKGLRVLADAEGPAGLRLPLGELPPSVPRRALALERNGDVIAIFVPPLLQKPFLELLAAIEHSAAEAGISSLTLQGYTPPDEASRWITLGLTADPGVLEVNLPACASWREYAEWIEAVTASCEEAGLRSWKQSNRDFPQGTGGGNHLLWGGPRVEANPFFSRPAWVAAILRFWQHHPSLAYLFTGCYVGASSQAPRPDESARDLYDIDMGYGFLESLPSGDHRALINETLRHLQTDVTGNSHRSEMSFDKFWNIDWAPGALGLIEFRAIESLPKVEWMASVALLWTCLAAHLLEAKAPRGLKRFGRKLHDEYLLPERLWTDFESVLAELGRAGITLKPGTYRETWNWRFPTLLEWKKNRVRLTVRRALESWPLLCETPAEGGTTSRFVDTSMHRLEFCGDAGFNARYRIYINGRRLDLRKASANTYLSGLRYRRTNLYPCMHPGIPTQLPLVLTIVERNSVRSAAQFEMGTDEFTFRAIPKAGDLRLVERPCRGSRKSDFTCDLRLD